MIGPQITTASGLNFSGIKYVTEFIVPHTTVVVLLKATKG